MISLLTCP